MQDLHLCLNSLLRKTPFIPQSFGYSTFSLCIKCFWRNFILLNWRSHRHLMYLSWALFQCLLGGYALRCKKLHFKMSGLSEGFKPQTSEITFPSTIFYEITMDFITSLPPPHGHTVILVIIVCPSTYTLWVCLLILQVKRWQMFLLKSV